jgi:hypothetical protein
MKELNISLRRTSSILRCRILEQNEIGDEGAKYQLNSALLEIRLDRNGVGPKGAKYLSERASQFHAADDVY